MSNTFKRTTHFTLVELLVVISIMMILAGLIQPSFKRLQNQAQILSCANQQKNLMQAGMFLLEDKNNTFPLGGYISGLPDTLADNSSRVTVEGEATHYVGAFSQYLEIPVRLDSKANHKSDLRVSENFTPFSCPMGHLQHAHTPIARSRLKFIPQSQYGRLCLHQLWHQ